MGSSGRHTGLTGTMAFSVSLPLTPEEDEEQLVMRRMRNSVAELKREMRILDYKMQRVKVKANQAKEQREKIELNEGTVCMTGEPSPFRAFIPQDEVVQSRRVYKVFIFFKMLIDLLTWQGCTINNRT